MARKREDKEVKAAQKKEQKAKAYIQNQEDANFFSFKNQLNTIGLDIKDIPGDGFVDYYNYEK